LGACLPKMHPFSTDDHMALLRAVVDIDDGYLFAKLTCDLTYWSTGQLGTDPLGDWEAHLSKWEQETLGQYWLSCILAQQSGQLMADICAVQAVLT
jgi:hypothetical protein